MWRFSCMSASLAVISRYLSRFFRNSLLRFLNTYMPVYSMTGFATSSTADSSAKAPQSEAAFAQKYGVQFELRSVNSRFLDLHFKLPDALRHLESALRTCMKNSLARGKVEIRAQMLPPQSLTQAGADGACDAFQPPSEVMLKQMAAANAAVQSVVPQAASLTVFEMLTLAQKYTTETQGAERSGVQEVDDEQVLAAMTSALDGLRAARAREGEALKKVMLNAVQALRELAAQAQPLVPEQVQLQQQRFLQRWNAALEQAGAQNGQSAGGAQLSNAVSAQAAQDRALAEAVAYALRIDIAEEIHRLQAHLDEIETILLEEVDAASHTKAKAKGKRLEFLIQELHREANTLGSKASTTALSRISVDMKVQVEQLREQVQNIE